MPEQHHTPDLEALETQLRRLAPRECAVDRDTLLYLAGRDAARGLWVWPLATGVSTFAAAVLAVLLTMQPRERVIYIPVAEPVPSPASSTSIAAEPVEAKDPIVVGELSPHRRLVEHLVRWGLDGLSPAPPPVTSPAPPRSLYSRYSDLSKGDYLP